MSDPMHVPFNPDAACTPTATQCPRCNNPWNACDKRLSAQQLTVEALFARVSKNLATLPHSSLYDISLEEVRAALDASLDGYLVVKKCTQEDRSWPEDMKHENHAYMCTCVGCDRTFLGYKRRVVCRVCAGGA